MRRLRVGLLGASRIAPKAMIAPVAKRDDIEIVAMACRDAGRGRAYAAEHGLPDIRIMDDYEALCSDPGIDILYNALPPSEHLRMALATTPSLSVHLVEKPFAMNAAQAKEMVSHDGAQRVIEAFHHHYHPAFALFRTRVAELGPLSRLRGRFHVPISDRPGELRHRAELGGGALMDLGTYMLHIARTLSRREPVVLSADAVEGSPRVDLRMEVALDFGDGLRADFSCDMREGVEREIWFEATGVRGTVRLDNPIHPYRGFVLSAPNGRVTMEDRPDWADLTTYDAQLDAILDDLRHGRKPRLDAADAVAQMEAINAIYTLSGLLPR